MQSYQILLSYQRARKEVTSPLSPAFDIHLLTAKQPVVLTDHGFPNSFCYLKAMGSQKFRAIYFRFQQHSKPFGRIPQVKNSFWVTSGPQPQEVTLHCLGETGSHHFRLFSGTNKWGPLSTYSIAAMGEEAGNRAALLHTGCKQNPHCSFTIPHQPVWDHMPLSPPFQITTPPAKKWAMVIAPPSV